MSTVQAALSTVNARTASSDSTVSFDSLNVLDNLLSMAPPPTPTHGKSYIRLVDASPDVATADVFMNGKHLLSDFEFGTVTGYITLPPGFHMVKVGMLSKGTSGSVITQTLGITSGSIYTFAVFGTKSEGFKLEGFNEAKSV